MVLALARPEPKGSHDQFSNGFLTGKELDPDFVDFNSVNRRYHFPFRFYLPFRGVFGQVDPIIGGVNPAHLVMAFTPRMTGTSRGPLRYLFVNGNPMGWMDPTGLLSVTHIKDDKRKGGCGGYEVDWDFRLSYPAICDGGGYFVQKVEIKNSTFKCPGGPEPDDKDVVYWEAFFVEPGSSQYYKRNKEFGVTDISSHEGPRKSFGSTYWKKEVRFYCLHESGYLGLNYVIGDLEKFGLKHFMGDDSNRGWGARTVNQAGDLPAFKSEKGSEPNLWKKPPTEGPVYFSTHAAWDCCCADGPTELYSTQW